MYIVYMCHLYIIKIITYIYHSHIYTVNHLISESMFPALQNQSTAMVMDFPIALAKLQAMDTRTGTTHDAVDNSWGPNRKPSVCGIKFIVTNVTPQMNSI